MSCQFPSIRLYGRWSNHVASSQQDCSRLIPKLAICPSIVIARIRAHTQDSESLQFDLAEDMGHLMRVSILAAILVVVPIAAHSDYKIGNEVVDCYCTDTSGERVEIGESTCLFVDGRSFIALCEMSLNNPIWRDTGESCNISQRSVPSSLNLAIQLPA